MIIYGKQIVLYAIAHHSDKICELYLAKEVDSKLFATIKSCHKPILRLDSKKAQALAHGGNHQGILARITPLESTPLASIKHYRKILVLCGISDMGNIGGIFRSAYALGVQAIIITQIKSPKIEQILRASSGAAFALPFCVVANTLDCINELKMAGFALYGADMCGENVARFTPAQKWALFLGDESRGLYDKIAKKLDKMLSIQMHNGFDSLNVSVAAGIMMAYLDSNKG